MLFDNDLTDFNTFMKTCVQDIGDFKSYKVNENAKNRDFGFGNLIVNRMSFIIFHDLSVSSIINTITGENNVELNKESMFYPSLEKLFKLLYNFGVYCHCYPLVYVKDKEAETEFYYVSQYLKYGQNIFRNIGDTDISLKEINYFDLSSHGAYGYHGTLLHKACCRGFHVYAEILINKDNFDIHKYNPFIPRERKTPLDIAKEQYSSFLLSLMKVE